MLVQSNSESSRQDEFQGEAARRIINT
ncbi:MAG TPA: palindromic element RPE3 domain-containing protein [Rickettsia endosymbiont of Columbicola hoogstraali]|nr:palindromic element RPE3 domain-containing protein [Rickettsia endosymbiont of Columbicola hoogstraali]